MKLCIQCKHQSGGGCQAPKGARMDPITGKPSYYHCETHRSSVLSNWLCCRIWGLCGREARWHEPFHPVTKKERDPVMYRYRIVHHPNGTHTAQYKRRWWPFWLDCAPWSACVEFARDDADRHAAKVRRHKARPKRSPEPYTPKS